MNVKVIIATLLLGGLVLQAAGAGAEPRPERGFAPEMDGMIALRLAERLNLADEQLAQIEGIVSGMRDAMGDIGSAMRDNHEALRSAVHSESLDAELVSQLAADIGSLTAQRIELGATVRNEIYLVLDPEQRAQLEQIHQNRPFRRGGHRGPEKRSG